MTRAVVAGSIQKAIEARTSKAGKPFAIGTVCESVNGGRRFWNCVAFNETVIQALRSIQAGAPINVAGEIDCEIWKPADGREPRLNWKITVDGVLTAQAPAKAAESRTSTTAEHPAGRSGAAPGGKPVHPSTSLDDDIPFAPERRLP